MEDIETKNTRLKELEGILSERGYPKEMITIGINKARSLNKKDLRTSQPIQTTENILTFVTTFNANNPSITSLLQTSITILKSSSKMKSALERTKTYQQQETTTKSKTTTSKIKIYQ